MKQNRKPCVLVVEDDPDLRHMMREFLADAGYGVRTAADGVAALAAFHAERFDMVLLDVMLPKVDGLAVAEVIRASSWVPIIIVSALDDEASQLAGYERQADDYVTKPVSMPVLLRKMDALLRRSRAGAGADASDSDASAADGSDMRANTTAPDTRYLRHGRLLLDTAAYRASVDGREIALTRREFQILELLLDNIGLVVTRETFLRQLWRFEFDVEERAVDNHIKNLRRKLGDAGDVIHTVRGVGYRIDPPSQHASGR